MHTHTDSHTKVKPEACQPAPGLKIVVWLWKLVINEDGIYYKWVLEIAAV